MAVVLGNIALLLDVTSPLTGIPDRKARTASHEVVLNLSKRDSHHSTNAYASLATKSFESDGEARNHRVVARGKANSKVNGVDSDAGSSDEEGNGNGNGNDDEDEETFDWEKAMRKRMKEIEEMKELEMKAEELQSRVAEGQEESEEEKRMRVRKELEKVCSTSLHLCSVWILRCNDFNFFFQLLIVLWMIYFLYFMSTQTEP